MSVSTIGERLKAVRLREGLPQAQFAAQLGYSKRALINWEHGDAEPPMAILGILRRAFDVDPEWVALGADTEPKSFFKQVDWGRFEAIERDVDAACDIFGLVLSEPQKTGLVRGLFENGYKGLASERDQLRATLRGLVKERRHGRR